MRKQKADGIAAVNTPKFRTEAEEAKWWDPNQDLVEDWLIRHGRRTLVPSRSVAMRLPVIDIERARRLAEKSGVGYQTLMKGLLHEALRRVERKAKAGSATG